MCDITSELPTSKPDPAPQPIEKNNIQALLVGLSEFVKGVAMQKTGAFKRDLGLLDLTMVGVGAIFGSSWLFAASKVVTMSGPAGVYSWIIGGVVVLLLGFVFCELGASIPSTGGIVHFPVVTHGRFIGFLMGLINMIAFTSLISIEVIASRQYASAWFPALTNTQTHNPTAYGWVFQCLMILFFFYINYKSVRRFAAFNNVVSLFKFLVPVFVIFALFAFFRPANFTSHEFMPFGLSGIEASISAGGVIFAYLGLTPIISIAGEVKNPQRTIPLALLISISLSTVMYILLQTAFIGSIPEHFLTQGWHYIDQHFMLPYHDIALALGLGWLAFIVVIDAVLSPSGAGNIYMNASPRVVYAWSKSGSFFEYFSKIDAASGIPRRALWLTLAMSLFWTLPFPSWEKLISLVSTATVMSYAIAPICAASLRRACPDLERPFRVKGFIVIGPLAFFTATMIVYWSGWQTVSWLLGIQILLYAIYVVYSVLASNDKDTFKQIGSSLWLIIYYAGLIAVSYYGNFGGNGKLTRPADWIVLAAFSLFIYSLAVRCNAINAYDVKRAYAPTSRVYNN